MQHTLSFPLGGTAMHRSGVRNAIDSAKGGDFSPIKMLTVGGSGKVKCGRLILPDFYKLAEFFRTFKSDFTAGRRLALPIGNSIVAII